MHWVTHLYICRGCRHALGVRVPASLTRSPQKPVRGLLESQYAALTHREAQSLSDPPNLTSKQRVATRAGPGIASWCLLHSPKAYRIGPSRAISSTSSPGQLTVLSGKQQPGRHCLTMLVSDIVRSTHPLKSGVPARKSGYKYTV
jgi:hypothetical protein